MSTIKQTLGNMLEHPSFKVALMQYQEGNSKDMLIMLINYSAHLLEIAQRNCGHTAAKYMKVKMNASDIKKKIVNHEPPNNLAMSFGKQQKPAITISRYGLVTGINNEAILKFGYFANDVIGADINNLIDHEDIHEIIFAPGKVENMEVTIGSRDGDKNIYLSAIKNSDEQGNTTGATLYLNDDISAIELVRAIEIEECKVVSINRKKVAKIAPNQLGLWDDFFKLAQ